MILKYKCTEKPTCYIWPFWFTFLLNLVLGNLFVGLSAFPHLTFKKVEIHANPKVDSMAICDPKINFLGVMKYRLQVAKMLLFIHLNISHLASANFYGSLTKPIATQFLPSLSKFHVGEVLQLF